VTSWPCRFAARSAGAGCNQLIRDGAILVQNAEDVMESLQPFGLKPVADEESAYRPEPPTDLSVAERETIIQC
jgi:DNA processing protein